MRRARASDSNKIIYMLGAHRFADLSLVETEVAEVLVQAWAASGDHKALKVVFLVSKTFMATVRQAVMLRRMVSRRLPERPTSCMGERFRTMFKLCHFCGQGRKTSCVITHLGTGERLRVNYCLPCRRLKIAVAYFQPRMVNREAKIFEHRAIKPPFEERIGDPQLGVPITPLLLNDEVRFIWKAEKSFVQLSPRLERFDMFHFMKPALAALRERDAESVLERNRIFSALVDDVDGLLEAEGFAPSCLVRDVAEVKKMNRRCIESDMLFNSSQALCGRPTALTGVTRNRVVCVAFRRTKLQRSFPVVGDRLFCERFSLNWRLEEATRLLEAGELTLVYASHSTWRHEDGRELRVVQFMARLEQHVHFRVVLTEPVATRVLKRSLFEVQQRRLKLDAATAIAVVECTLHHDSLANDIICCMLSEKEKKYPQAALRKCAHTTHLKPGIGFCLYTCSNCTAGLHKAAGSSAAGETVV